jgi:hypothetical protein
MVFEGRLPSKLRCGTSSGGRSLHLHFLARLPESQCLGLGEYVRDQNVVVCLERMERLAERDEVAGDDARALVEELVERMLAVGAWLAPVDGPGVPGDLLALEGHALAVALHRELLQVRREPLQVLFVGEDRGGRCSEEVVVPDREQAHEHGQVRGKGRGPEVLVHLPEAIEQRAEVGGADGEHGR